MTDDEFMLTLNIQGISDAERAYAAFKRLNAEVGEVKDRAEPAGKHLDSVGKSAKGAGQGAMQAAYAIDDLQYGIRGVVNNIPQLLSSLGMGAGLAGALSIVAVGISQVVKHWDDLTALFRGDDIANAARDMAALAAASDKVAGSLPRTAEVGRGVEAIGAAGAVQAAMMTSPSAEDQAFRKGAKGVFATAEAADVAAIIGRGLSMTKDVGIPANDIVNSGFGGSAGRNVGVRRVQLSDEEKAAEVMARFSRAATHPGNLRSAQTAVDAALGRDNLTDSDRAKLTAFSKQLKELANDDAGERIGKAFGQFADNLARGLNVAAREVESKTKESAAREAEKIGKAFGDMTASALEGIAAENRKLAAMSPTQRLFAGQGDMSFEDRVAENQDYVRQAQANMAAAQFKFMTAGDPNAARLLRQQQAAADRFNAPGSALATLQRQTAIRAAGGIDAINQRREAFDEMKAANEVFREAVQRLQSDGVEAVIR